MKGRLSTNACMGIELGFTALSLIFVILRLCVRWHFQSRRISSGDISIILAWICFAYMVAADVWNWKNGMWNETQHFTQHATIEPLPTGVDDATLIRSFQLIFAAGVSQYLSVWFVKIAFILLYYEIISRDGSMRKLRFVLDLTTAITVVGFVVMLLLNVFYCWPISRNWELDHSCWTWAKYPVYFTTLAFHLLTDILIYCIPFALIPILGISRRKQVGVGAMFGLGFISIICTIGRTVMVGTSFWVTNSGAFSAAEVGTAIMVACCPPLKWLITSGGSSLSSKKGQSPRETWGNSNQRHFQGERRRRSQCVSSPSSGGGDVESGVVRLGEEIAVMYAVARPVLLPKRTSLPPMYFERDLRRSWGFEIHSPAPS